MKAIALVLFLLTAHPSFAQAPYLVKDIKTAGTPGSANSGPSGFVSTGTDVLFLATTEQTGRELYKFDGVSTSLLKDIYPGPGSSYPTTLMPLGNGAFVFGATDEQHGMELWRTDGSAAGTVLVKDIRPGAEASWVSPLRVVNGLAYFTANDGVHGSELWVTDGSAAGTRLVKDFDGDSSDTTLRVEGPLGNQLFVMTNVGVWRTNGTSAGTLLVKPGIIASSAVVLGNRLIFRAWQDQTAWDLWSTDGTEAGTTRLTDLFSQGADVASSLTAFAEEVLFFVQTRKNLEGSIWRSDGTSAGTYRLATVTIPCGTCAPLVSGDKLLYVSAGSRLYAWDRQGKVLTRTSDPTVTELFAAFGGAVHFVAAGQGGRRLRRTDGTDEGTVTVGTFPITGFANPAYTGGRLFFAGADAATGSEPWVSETGSTESTRRIADVATSNSVSSWPTSLIAAGDRVGFYAYHDGDKDMYWTSDGTQSGTDVLDDAPPGRSSNVQPASHKGAIYYAKANALWKSDGSGGGPSLVKEFPTPIRRLRSTSRHLYVGVEDKRNLWRTDGTPQGTLRVETSPVSDYHSSGVVAEIAGTVYAQGNQSVLWQLSEDGTMSPTGIRMADTPVLSAGGVMYYAGGNAGNELWRSDGTVAGTRKVALGGSSSSAPSNFTSAGRFVYFLYANALWRTDGTEAGTISLIFVDWSFWMTALGDHLYFPYAAYPSSRGEELYRTDGTVAGTELVADIAPGSWSSYPYSGVALNGLLWFSASDTLHGSELWVTEGTAASTRRVSDIFPGPDHGAPEHFAAAGSRLFFAAFSPGLGKELWALDLGGSSFSISDARTIEGTSGTRSLRFTITRNGDRTPPASVVVSTEPGTATAAVDFETTSSTLDFAAGESSRVVDVLVNGDVQSEGNESFWVVLASPVNARIASGRAAGIIEDDDGPVDLSVEILPAGSTTLRKVRVRNSGSSIAAGVEVRVTESPALVPFRTLFLPTLLPGTSQDVGYSRMDPASMRLDSANPAGITMQVTVSSANVDSNPANNATSGMIDPGGIAVFPASLAVSTTAPASVLAATPVSITTDALLSITPSSQIQGVAPDYTATVTLQAGGTPGRARVQAGGATPFSYPIVASGAAATLGTALEVIGARGAQGTPLTFRLNVLGTRPDGTRPTGTITLRDKDGNVLAQASLNANASVTFTRSGLGLGSWPHQVHYSGDAHFDPLTTEVVLTVAARSSRRRATR